MDPSEESQARASRAFSVASLVLGLLALAARVAHEVAQADLGSDLGIDGPWVRLLFHWGSAVVAGLGLCSAIAALTFAPSWRLRFGSPLPGMIVNGVAILWWFAEWA
jgi:hypothetical protein